jgi:uroporphyrinogen-III synthase
MTHNGAAGRGAAGSGVAASAVAVGNTSSNRRVLVTRPAGQETALCNAVQGAGYTVFSQPLLELRAVSELSAPQRQLLLDLDRYQHIIFISGNAVSFGMDCIENYWPQLPAALNWYAIGEATADLLEKFGIDAITPGAVMTSEGLLAVAPLQKVADQRILIVKGEGGRATLRQELQRRGGWSMNWPAIVAIARICPPVNWPGS